MNFGDKVNDLCAKGILVLGKSEKKAPYCKQKSRD